MESPRSSGLNRCSDIHDRLKALLASHWMSSDLQHNFECLDVSDERSLIFLDLTMINPWFDDPAVCRMPTIRCCIRLLYQLWRYEIPCRISITVPAAHRASIGVCSDLENRCILHARVSEISASHQQTDPGIEDYQWSGTNAITQYSPTILEYLGIAGEETCFLTTGSYAIVEFC